MYPWIVFLHLLGLLGFVLAHGASAAAAFALRRERGLEKVQALLLLSTSTYGVMYISLLVLLVTGIIAGFMGQWWGWGWIWVSLGLLVAIIVAMSILGSPVYGRARKAAGLPYFEGGKQRPAEPAPNPAELDAALSRANPVLLAVIGYVGLALITWLMMFKPF
jgi:small-conductance mechanosensitive channel